jgi:hypothetical protein
MYDRVAEHGAQGVLVGASTSRVNDRPGHGLTRRRRLVPKPPPSERKATLIGCDAGITQPTRGIGAAVRKHLLDLLGCHSGDLGRPERIGGGEVALDADQRRDAASVALGG